MAIPTTPATAERPPWKNITPLQGTSIRLTTNQTNTATSATQVTGVTDTFVIPGGVTALKVCVQGDSVSNSGANNVILTLWNGTVGTGTQIGQWSATAQSGALVPLCAMFVIFVGSPGTSITLNLGMHGSGAGTNTIAASTTAPFTFWVEAF